MKHLLLALAVTVGTAATASATVTYSTTGTFNCTNGAFADAVSGTDTISGCNSGAVTLNDPALNEAITLLFNNISSQSLNASNGTVASYGSIQASCVGAGCVGNATTITLGSGILNLAVLISESAPDVSLNNSAGIAHITGGIAFDSSNLTIGSYTGSPVTVTGLTDSVIYTLDTSDTLFSPSNGPLTGLTGLGMTITDTNVVNSTAPEPATFAFVGFALTGLGLYTRRRRA